MINKKKRRVSFILVILLLLSLLLLIANILYELIISANQEKKILWKGLHTQTYEDTFVVNDFFSTTPYNHIYINSDDKLQLHAYEFVNTGHCEQWVIVLHGYMGDATQMAYQAHHFYELGYNVLVPDLRGHGLSEGDYIGMGWVDRFDLLAWTHYLINVDPNNKIIFYGISMGATTLLNACGEKLPYNVSLAIADCAFTSVWDIFTYQLDASFHLPSFPLLNMLELVNKYRSHYTFKEADTRKQLTKAQIPILFIHSKTDDFVPFKMMEELYQSTSSIKEKLVIKKAWHGASSLVEPKTYWRKVNNFIAKYQKLELKE
ncbi:MAG: alpha/beta hydrolase [Erysipelotrichia bacterium]|nr:alpha/beta hydrolase [Erysipelotrichia bacterium]NCC55493.1 alpha/beta hydrolase [Erysipelotrichia bacterium]